MWYIEARQDKNERKTGFSEEKNSVVTDFNLKFVGVNSQHKFVWFLKKIKQVLGLAIHGQIVRGNHDYHTDGF